MSIEEDVGYSVAGRNYLGFLARPARDGDRRPGVLVFPEAFGLGDHARDRARRLAELGYIALAVDIHGDGRLYDDLAELGPAIQSIYGDRAAWRASMQAALDTLLAQADVDRDRIAAIGFCFGGSCCLELARTGAPLAVIATFHAGLLPELPEDTGRIKAKVLICHGADDGVVKEEDLKTVMGELSRDTVDWQCIYYGNTVHSFTEPAADSRGMPGFAYSADVDRRSWALMCALFAECFAEGVA